jgi:flagellin-like protein
MMKVKRAVKAISPVIATLLMIAITVVASLVAYAWVTNYSANMTTKTGNAILIQSVTTTGLPNQELKIYVQNIGQNPVAIGSVYVEGELYDFAFVPAVQANMLEVGQTGAILISEYKLTSSSTVNVKVATADGTFTQISQRVDISNGQSEEPEYLFADGFESGDLSAWTETRFDSSSSVVVQTTHPQSGIYNAKFTTSPGSYAYEFKTLVSIAEVYSRSYVTLGNLPTGANSFVGLQEFDTASGSTLAVAIVRNDGTHNFWGLRVKINGITTYYYSTSEVVVDTTYCLELHAKVDATDGGYSLYVNGNQVLSIIGQKTDNAGLIGAYKLGITYVSAAASYTVYGDTVAVNNNLIGS